MRGESALAGPHDSAGGEVGLQQIIGREPSPDFALQVAEECRRLLDRLDDDTLRSVALLKMEGHTNDEIAFRLGFAPRTVERKLRRIRTLWSQSIPG